MTSTEPNTFVMDNGEWIGVQHHADHDAAFDEYFILSDETHGSPARGRRYRITLTDGSTIEDRTDQHDRTQLATSNQAEEVKIEVWPQDGIGVF